MFKRIVAIDVAERIPLFLESISSFTKSDPFCVESAAQLSFLENPDEVDCLLISIYESLSQEQLARFPNLSYIGVLGTSLKKIPLDYCRERKIAAANVTEYCDEDTAEWVMMKILEFLRKRAQPQSAWGKSLGIIGVGAVGKHVIDMASGFHMNILYNAQTARPDLDARGFHFARKEEILRNCEVVSVHTPAFLSWLSRDLLVAARKNLCLINTCMGRISPEDDLHEALTARDDITLIMDKIAGDNYPELKDRAQIFKEAAFSTVDARARLIDKFFSQLAAHMAQ